eukprot:gnl/MRDRNA2_/MRDRNA2_55772_c0_seq1.p1 gnl/MRDRNA2_/MRDRNA2_55772_c0~~gnl/MRDRNA2_/MRDRNA2_55772_c0_seq1.p1  ORF type:complete len:319 (+),score=54.02 gnl/MRDRNA2_/MRDRNA2_55772_c0_seq1:111-1067(+)
MMHLGASLFIILFCTMQADAELKVDSELSLDNTTLAMLPQYGLRIPRQSLSLPRQPPAQSLSLPRQTPAFPYSRISSVQGPSGHRYLPPLFAESAEATEAEPTTEPPKAPAVTSEDRELEVQRRQAFAGGGVVLLLGGIKATQNYRPVTTTTTTTQASPAEVGGVVAGGAALGLAYAASQGLPKVKVKSSLFKSKVSRTVKKLPPTTTKKPGFFASFGGGAKKPPAKKPPAKTPTRKTPTFSLGTRKVPKPTPKPKPSNPFSKLFGPKLFAQGWFDDMSNGIMMSIFACSGVAFAVLFFRRRSSSSLTAGREVLIVAA